MSICPKCKEEIDYLNNYISGEAKYIFDGESYNQDGDFQNDGKVSDYECPECQEVLFTDEEKAKEFLEDKDELTEIISEKLKQIKEKKNAHRNRIKN